MASSSAQVTWYTVCFVSSLMTSGYAERRLLAVVTPLLQARCPAWTKMGVVYDEHLVFLLHLKQYQRTRSSPGRMPVTDQV
ncbi:MAG TPA: hypothetical protein VNW73_06605 [Ktedonobacteraceae bacterium]|nr:hypothetical protein [Ktedonobacteraceae bacterium]